MRTKANGKWEVIRLYRSKVFPIETKVSFADASFLAKELNFNSERYLVSQYVYFIRKARK